MGVSILVAGCWAAGCAREKAAVAPRKEDGAIGSGAGIGSDEIDNAPWVNPSDIPMVSAGQDLFPEAAPQAGPPLQTINAAPVAGTVPIAGLPPTGGVGGIGAAGGGAGLGLLASSLPALLSSLGSGGGNLGSLTGLIGPLLSGLGGAGGAGGALASFVPMISQLFQSGGG